MAPLRVSTTKFEWLPDDPTGFVPSRRWKLPFITTWDDFRNQNHPTDSAEEAFPGACSQYFVRGTITLSTPLIASDSSTQTLTPISFSFTDNDSSHPVLTSGTAYFYIYSTNAQDLPTSWAIYLGSTSYTDCSGSYEIQTISSSPFDCSNGGSPSFYQGTDASKGSWGITPEPASLLLYGTGLLGIAAYLRRGSLVRQA